MRYSFFKVIYILLLVTTKISNMLLNFSHYNKIFIIIFNHSIFKWSPLNSHKIKGLFGCLFLITQFLLPITHHSSLKIPNSLHPTPFGTITHLLSLNIFQLFAGPTHWPNASWLFSLLFIFYFSLPLPFIFLCFCLHFSLFFSAFLFIHVNTYFNQAHHDPYYHAFPKSIYNITKWLSSNLLGYPVFFFSKNPKKKKKKKPLP